MPKVEITNLAFQGGSVKGTAYLGSLETLEERIDMKLIKRVAGTSAGSLTACLLAVGCDVAKVRELLLQFDFKEVLDERLSGTSTRSSVLKSVSKQEEGKPGFFSKIPAKMVKVPIAYRLAQEFGVYEGEFIREWIENLIRNQVSTLTAGEHSGVFLTFGELHELTLNYPGLFRDLAVVGTNLSVGKKTVFNFFDPETQDVIISDAIQISMSIPYLFKPHPVYYKNNGMREVEVKRDIWVDGGVYENYPIRCFDRPEYLNQGQALKQAEDGLFYNPHTLGFRLVSPTHKNELEGLSDSALENDTVTSLLSFSKLMLGTNFHLQEEQYSRAENRERTVYIDHRNVSTLAFNLTEEQQKDLILSGQMATNAYLKHRKTQIELIKDYENEVEEEQTSLTYS